MKIITLLTDFGTKDSYVAEMKGVILSLVPGVSIVDITHNVRPQNILEASFILANSFYYFPENSVHLVVVDPGVGTSRDILVVKAEHYTFIGPDNGVLYESANRDGIKDIFSIDVREFRFAMLSFFKGNIVAERVFGGEISKTFHGRDIFAPLSAYCFLDGSWEGFSVKKNGLQAVEGANPVISDGKIFGKVIYIDHFGNLITNISGGLLNKVLKNYQKTEVFIKLMDNLISVGELHQTYSDADKGRPLALVGSRGYIEVAVNYGNASKFFGVSDSVDVLVVLS